MADSPFSASRLVVARRRARLSQADLADKVQVTQAAISDYERGRHRPSPDVVDRLAAATRFYPSFLRGADVRQLRPQEVTFRSLSRLSAPNRDAALAAGVLATIVSSWIDERFHLASPTLADLRGEQAEPAAQAVRGLLRLGEAPIANMVHVLEALGVRVYSLAEECADLDAFSFWHDGLPYVLLNSAKSAERSRMDAAHELAHLVLHRHAPASRAIERDATDFASALLMPPASMRAQAPTIVTLDGAMTMKRIWGVSLAAVVARLRTLDLISDWTYRRLFIEIGKRGWRTREPQPMPRERSQVLDKVFSALRDDGLDRADVAQQTGVPIEELASLTFALRAAPVGSSKVVSPTGRPRMVRVK